jgi:hypothetical protein
LSDQVQIISRVWTPPRLQVNFDWREGTTAYVYPVS